MKKFITFLLLFALTGCGFHLRRPMPLPPELDQVMLMPDATYTPLRRELTNQLANVGCTVVDAGTKLTPTLTILSDSYSNITLSVGSDGQTREKLLIYALTYTLTNAQGLTIVPPTLIRLNRVVKYDPNFVLAKGYEEDKMLHDMRIDAVIQVVSQLSFVDMKKIVLPDIVAPTAGSHPQNSSDIPQESNIYTPDNDLMPEIDTDLVGD